MLLCVNIPEEKVLADYIGQAVATLDSCYMLLCENSGKFHGREMVALDREALDTDSPAS
jgi:hypothetical protein